MPSSRLALKKLLAITVGVAVFALLNAALYSGRAVASSAQAKEKSNDDAKEKEMKEEPKKKVQGLPLKPDRSFRNASGSRSITATEWPWSSRMWAMVDPTRPHPMMTMCTLFLPGPDQCLITVCPHAPATSPPYPTRHSAGRARQYGASDRPCFR